MFANAIIIATASIYNLNLFWLLLTGIPILTAGIYKVKQRKSIARSVWHYWPFSDKKAKSKEWPSLSIYTDKRQKDNLKVLIGNDQCSQPYSTCVFNIGSIKNIPPKKFSGQQLSDKKLDCSKNLSEERLRTYCLAGEDFVLQINGRNANGNFNSKLFQENACRPEVKMIEWVLTNGSKPVWKPNSSSDIGNVFKETKYFPGSPYFTDAEWMTLFLDSLRKLSARKPIGIRLCISDKKKFHELCYAIRKTHIIPDFIVVEDSSESSTTVDLEKKSIHTLIPIYEALLFASQTLQNYKLDKEIKIIASVEIKSYFDVLKVLALGADAIFTYPSPYDLCHRKTFSFHKGGETNDLHNKIMRGIMQAMNVCGCRNVSEITLSKFFLRLDTLHTNGSETPNVPVANQDTIKMLYNSKVKYHIK